MSAAHPTAPSSDGDAPAGRLTWPLRSVATPGLRFEHDLAWPVAHARTHHLPAFATRWPWPSPSSPPVAWSGAFSPNAPEEARP